MKQFIRRVRQDRRAFFYIKLFVASAGIFLSVILHEAFHAAVHWGSITKVELFPDYSAILAITSRTAPHYDVILEEGIAYAITLVTMLATLRILYTMQDKRDEKSFTQTVFPRNKSMQKLDHHELYELAVRIKLV